MTDSRALTIPQSRPVGVMAAELPSIVDGGGSAARFAWEEFFAANIRNVHTRTAYMRAVRRFLEWLPADLVLTQITPGMVGTYFSNHPGSPPTRKLHLAAIRGLFDLMVTRHVMVLNPALSVRGERYQVMEGKTPEISIDQARRLIGSIKTTRATRRNAAAVAGADDERPNTWNVVGLRDRAIVGCLIYTAARAGAIARLRRKHFVYDGVQWNLRFEEKGGKSREIPVRADLQIYILEYLDAGGSRDDPGDTPLFQSATHWTCKLTGRAMTGVDVCRMVKRRLKAAGLPTHLSPHSFRVTTVTDLLTQGVPLEDVQYLAGHADPRTTRLYDRRQKRVTRNIVERISV